MAEFGNVTVQSLLDDFDRLWIDDCSCGGTDSCRKPLSCHFVIGRQGAFSIGVDHEHNSHAFLFYRRMCRGICSWVSRTGDRGRKIQGMYAFCIACRPGAFMVSNLVWLCLGAFKRVRKHFDPLFVCLCNGQLLPCDEICGDAPAFARRLVNLSADPQFFHFVLRVKKRREVV